MKIVCDNCATKYSIADEKVRGKVFKIRCKKCSHIIVVRGSGDGGTVEASSAAAAPADTGFPGDEAPAARGAASGDQVWHLVIDREQVGPLSPSEVRAKFAAGEIDAETYAWREGFGDWLRLASIEDFRDLGGAAGGGEGTKRTEADLFGGQASGSDEGGGEAPSGDLFGNAPTTTSPPSGYAGGAAASASEDVFGGGGGGGAGLFGAPSAAAAPAPRASRSSSPGFAASAEPASASAGGGVDVRPMTGQRNENSVLFSLNNLQALATGGGGARPSAGGGGGGGGGGGSDAPRPGFASSQTEGSGLIDIRAMAASTLAASPTGGPMGGKGDELPGLGAAPVFSPMAAPILMPAAPSGPPKWMWAILGVGVLAVLGIVVVGVLLLTRKPEPPVVAAAPQAPAAPVAAAPAAKPGAPAAAPGTPAAATPGAPAAVAANTPAPEKHAAAPAAKHEKAEKPGKALAKAEPAAAKAEPAAPAAAPAAAPKKSGKHDELDDLLNNASPGGDTPKPKKAAAAREEPSSGGGGGDDSSLPDQLDKGAIVAGMSKVKARVISCYDQFKVPGMANVALTIGNSGHVTNASVTGTFAGTPTGECVAKAVKGASFPRFKGAAQTINYPYMLR